MNQKEIEEIKNRYPKGTKIKLIEMNDVQAPPIGTTGIIDFVDDIGQIHISWNNGSSLALIPDVDKFEIID